jgi:anti-sigma regulatory factor (Ser/Thr protein kinase)
MIASGFLIDGSQDAASEVGGDYYDVFSLPGQKVGIAVADVAGKGLAGCLVMSMLSALLGAYRDQYDSPSALLARLDERLSEHLRPGMFVTMFYGILDPKTGKLVFASAGHLPSFVYRCSTGVVEKYASGGIPLGAIRGGAIRPTLADETVELGPNDLLVQYTDGINEAFDRSGESQFDFERMEQTIATCASKGGEAVLDGLRADVATWRGGGARLDDETILVVSRELESDERGTVALPRDPADKSFDDPLARLAEARGRGEQLVLCADLGQLDAISEWLAGRTRLGDLDRNRMELLGTALYEACANIIEHGYRQDPARQLVVWWVPDRRAPRPGLGAGGIPVRSAPGAVETMRRGFFLILDQGEPFSADNWEATDFADRKVWRRSRGFGLDIIHRVMSRVRYSPTTPEGNITLMAFDDSSEETEMDRRALPHE